MIVYGIASEHPLVGLYPFYYQMLPDHTPSLSITPHLPLLSYKPCSAEGSAAPPSPPVLLCQGWVRGELKPELVIERPYCYYIGDGSLVVFWGS